MTKTQTGAKRSALSQAAMNRREIMTNTSHKAQGLPKLNDAAYPMHQEEKEITKKPNKQTRVTNNRNFIMQILHLSSLTVMVKIHAVSSKLWQELPQSIHELL